MLPEDFSDILTVGGTILGTSRQPFKEMRKTIETVRRPSWIKCCTR